MSAGSSHTCLVSTSSRFTCWGDNKYNQSKYLHILQSGKPLQVKHLDAGGAHNCILFDDEAMSEQAGLNYNKNMHCWGLNDSGQTDIPYGLDHGILRVSAGLANTCVIKQDVIDIKEWVGKTEGDQNKQKEKKEIEKKVSEKDKDLKEKDLIEKDLKDLKDDSENGIINVNKDIENDDQINGNFLNNTHEEFNYLKKQNTNLLNLYDNISLHMFDSIKNGSNKFNNVKSINNETNSTSNSNSDTQTKVYTVNIVVCFGNFVTNIPLDLRTRAINLSTGCVHACVIKSLTITTLITSTTPIAPGRLGCWGNNEQGQTNIPESIQDKVYQVGTGLLHTCMLYDYGMLKCIGSNIYGQNCTMFTGYIHKSIVSQISVGPMVTCLMPLSGNLICQGNNKQNMLNVPNEFRGMDGMQSKDMSDSGGNGNKQYLGDQLADIVAVGNSHVCALRNSKNKPVCWGSNDKKQLLLPKMFQ